jgi:hypothetical protein
MKAALPSPPRREARGWRPGGWRPHPAAFRDTHPRTLDPTRGPSIDAPASLVVERLPSRGGHTSGIRAATGWACSSRLTGNPGEFGFSMRDGAPPKVAPRLNARLAGLEGVDQATGWDRADLPLVPRAHSVGPVRKLWPIWQARSIPGGDPKG